MNRHGIGAEPKKITLKMPKELEMPKMKDHQMFDRVRIVELQDELQDNFKKLKVSGKAGADYLSTWYCSLWVSKMVTVDIRYWYILGI